MLRACLRGGTLNQLGGPIVAMVQPSKSSVRHDPTGSRGGSSARRCLLRKTKMRAVFLVIADVFREQPFQMAFIERDDMIQQVAAAASHPALRRAILPGAFEGSANRMDAQGANSDRDFQPVLGIAIEEQKPGRGIKGKGFAQLLDDPQARGVFGDVEVQNASRFVADDEEAVVMPRAT